MKPPKKEMGFWLGQLAVIGVSTLAAAQVSFSPAPRLLEALATTHSASVDGMTGSLSKPIMSPIDHTASELPDAPSAVARSLSQQDPPAGSSSVQSPPPRPQPPANSMVGPTFLIANGFLLGSTIFNAEMISRCRPSACQAVPDAIRHRGDLYGIGIPSSLAVSYISYRLKRSGTRMWFLPVAVLTAGNIIYAAHAAQYSNSSGVARSAARAR